MTDVSTSQPREVNTRSAAGETQPGFENIMLSDTNVDDSTVGEAFTEQGVI